MRIPNKTSCFPYGSRIYNTHSENSDIDVVAVFHLESSKEKHIEMHRALKNAFPGCQHDLHLVNSTMFQDRLDRHEMSALECYFLPEELRFSNSLKFKFKLDKKRLFFETIENSDKSWNKAYKYLDTECYDADIGCKAVFHSIRVVDFAQQIVDYGRIVDYTRSNRFLVWAKELSEWV